MGAVVKAIKKAVKAVVDVVKKAVKFVTTVVKNVVEVIKTGNILDIIAVAVMVGTQNWGALAKYATIRVAVPAITAAAAEMGWISQEIALAINFAAVAYGMYTSWTSSAANPESWFGHTVNPLFGEGAMASTLSSLGVSDATISVITNITKTLTPFISIAKDVYAIYGIYSTIEMVKQMQLDYLKAIAAFEAWKANFNQSKAYAEGTHQEAMDYATGSYYKKLPGQQLYHVFMPGREAYVAMEATAPAYWVETRESPFTTERVIAGITWKSPMSFEDKFNIDPDSRMNIV